jgi:hypothetical protein
MRTTVTFDLVGLVRMVLAFSGSVPWLNSIDRARSLALGF